MLLAILIGSIPFSVALIIGTIFRRIWIGYPIGFTATTAITVYSSVYPETFRFGSTDLRIHDGLTIAGNSPLIANCAKNLFFA